jgi:hypothetical protein
MTQNHWQRFCVWSGIITPLLFFVAFAAGHWVPPLSPSVSATDIAAHYREHTTGIRIGGVLMMMSGMFYASYTAVISAQMARIKGVHPAVVLTQSIAGASACITFMLPGLLFVVAAFRPERSPELTQMLNDLVWIVLVMPWPPFMVQNFAFAFAILTQDMSQELFPRWLAYLNIWAPIVFTPAVLLPFFKSGPFAWNGIFVLWVPGLVFVIQFVMNVRYLHRAVGAPETTPYLEDPRARDLREGSLHAE